MESRPPLGVFALISESFTLLRQNFTPIAILALAVTVVAVAFEYIIAPPGSDPMNINILGLVLGIASGMFVFGIQTAILTGIAYDSKQGNPVDLAGYVKLGLAIIFPLLLLLIVLSLGISIGFLLLIVPGVIMVAMFAVAVPVLVIERSTAAKGSGLGAMRRSAELTKGYRWPILGFLLLVYLIVFAAGAVAEILTGGFDPFSRPPMALTFVVGLIVNFFGSVFGLGTALLYARLREIKEGVGMGDLAKVFE